MTTRHEALLQPMRRRSSALRHSPVAAAGLAVLVALVALPLSVRPVAAASASYIAACPANLRASASTDAPIVDVIAAGTPVTVAGVKSGDSWSSECGSSTSGKRWYVITAVAGTSTASRYGVDQVYAATGLFRMQGTLEGLDVSGWQGTIDYARVAAFGKRFVIAKATEGIGFTDSKWARNRTSAPAAGIALGGYHFARPDLNPGNPEGEADWFVSQLDLAPGMLVPALDLERHGPLSKAELRAWVGSWLAEVYRLTGVKPMIYTSPSFWESYLGDTSTFADQGYEVLWIAHWFVARPRVPGDAWGGNGWTFWQYDDCGKVPGISGCVDLDRFKGLDLTRVTYGADFDLAAASTTATSAMTAEDAASASVKQGGTATFDISIQRQFFTLPIALEVTGLPAGATATLDPTTAGGNSATLRVTTSESGTITPVGTYALTVTGRANGLTRSTTATLRVTDGIAPTVAAPASRLFATTAIGGGATPVRTRWSATDPRGIDSYALQRQRGSGDWQAVSLASVTSVSDVDALSFGREYRYRIRATDGAGNTSAWTYGPSFVPRLAQQSAAAVDYAGRWRRAATDWASGGSVRYARAKGATATYQFTGASVAWVAARGPTRGAASVYVDGVFVTRVNLHASTFQAKQVVFARTWSANGRHTLTIVVRGTDGHPRVDVDAFVRLVRR